jgi:hypothetical protein
MNSKVSHQPSQPHSNDGQVDNTLVDLGNGIGSTRVEHYRVFARGYSTCWRFRAIRTPLSRTTVWLMKS